MGILLQHSLLLDPKYTEKPVEFVGVFPRGYVSIVAGVPGVGKTWFMLDVCRSIADGLPILSDADGEIHKGKALIFAGETGVRMLVERMQMLGGVDNLPSIRVVSSHEMARLDIDVMINTAIGRKNIDEAIKEFRPDLVFFDTVISFMSGGKDESSQADMTDPIRGLSAIAGAYNTAIVLMHHFRKRPTQTTDTQSRGLDEVIGSSALTRLASLVVGIERKREMRFCHCIKSWWKEFAPFSFIIKQDCEGSLHLEACYDYTADGDYSVVPGARRVLAKIKEELKGEAFCQKDVEVLGYGRDLAARGIRLGITNREIIESGRRGNAILYSLVGDDTRQGKLAL